MNWLSLRNNQLKVQSFRKKTLIILEESMDWPSNEWRRTERSQDVTGWELETLGFFTDYAQTPPLPSDTDDPGCICHEEVAFGFEADRNPLFFSLSRKVSPYQPQ